MRKVSPVASRNTHVHDVTTVNNVSDSYRFQRRVDSTDQKFVTVTSSHDIFVNDDVTKISNFEVVEPRSQSSIGEKLEGYFLNHELNTIDLMYHEEIT